MVTGASGGIGKAVALGLARLGATVVLACRHQGRGEAARREIVVATGNENVELLLVDVASRASLARFAAAFRQRHNRLDVLVNNAGLWSSTRQLSPDGIELTWATNMLGYAHLTRLLLDRLRAAENARIVTVASDLAYGLDLSDPEFEHRRYAGIAAYAQSKQANRLWTWALARRLEGTGVTANALHPGGVDTGIFRKGGGLTGWLTSLWARGFGRTPEEGADTALYLAAGDDVEGRTGAFYHDRKERPCQFRDRTQEEALFTLCESYFDRDGALRGAGSAA